MARNFTVCNYNITVYKITGILIILYIYLISRTIFFNKIKYARTFPYKILKKYSRELFWRIDIFIVFKVGVFFFFFKNWKTCIHKFLILCLRSPRGLKKKEMYCRAISLLEFWDIKEAQCFRQCPANVVLNFMSQYIIYIFSYYVKGYHPFLKPAFSGRKVWLT